MRFERVRLENFKCYRDIDLELASGVTVIHGINGSGKSSLLEACFFALYGARALDRTLEEVVRVGAEDATVELVFTHGGERYRIERRVRVTGDGAQTAKCVLETPDGTVEGARDVRARIAGLLRMDAEAFTNCAYVQQGEVNKLINATPGQRQDMIDDLLQLGKLEEYRERASEARLGVEDVLTDNRGRLAELEEQVERREAEDLHARLNELRSDLAALDEKIDNYEAQRERAESTRDDAAQVLERHEEHRERIDELQTEVDELESDIAAAEREREEARDAIREQRERVDDLEERARKQLADIAVDELDADVIASRLDELDTELTELADEAEELRMEATAFENQAERLNERADENEERAEDRREQAETAEERAEEAVAELAERRSTLADLEAEAEELGGRFDAAPVERGAAEDYRDGRQKELEACREAVTATETRLESVRERLAEARKLREEGKCPECGQPVEGSPHVDRIDEDEARVEELESNLDDLREKRERLAEAMETATELVETERRLAEITDRRDLLAERVEELESTVTEHREAAAEHRETVDELAEEAAEKREIAAEKMTEAAETREDLECVESAVEIHENEVETLERVEETLDTVAEAEREIERLADRREAIDETNDERRARLADKRETLGELREEFDVDRVEEARANKQKAERYIEQVETELEDLDDRRDELVGDVRRVEGRIDDLEELREKRDRQSECVEALEELHEESEELEAMYGDLRAELRQHNVETLERMLNETFDLVYQNDSYARIELDGEYELTVYQKDGEPLEPEQLSGGERALFNLSLRTAIYRLLAEGIEGAAPMPPLILDEPTVFLDSGHVSKLVELVESMRDLGVEQIVVVSHDHELVGAADDLVTVRKDATSNCSTAERTPAVALSGVEADD